MPPPNRKPSFLRLQALSSTSRVIGNLDIHSLRGNVAGQLSCELQKGRISQSASDNHGYLLSSSSIDQEIMWFIQLHNSPYPLLNLCRVERRFFNLLHQLPLILQVPKGFFAVYVWRNS
ncbi:uncharacterized protein LOC111448820 isoform X2 [Cucurbita moschata]|uniref:Uncharacterized protein LOC111448820 isoform X2 n=1 Tax=Cucurbita moschata TaxID=3662 RepID=A0A6J1FYL9_CUCMO|nr:uncharacterized protein LOC111448820 isoform X2 [Cucurbita moschata]